MFLARGRAVFCVCLGNSREARPAPFQPQSLSACCVSAASTLWPCFCYGLGPAPPPHTPDWSGFSLSSDIKGNLSQPLESHHNLYLASTSSQVSQGQTPPPFLCHPLSANGKPEPAVTWREPTNRSLTAGHAHTLQSCIFMVSFGCPGVLRPLKYYLHL